MTISGSNMRETWMLQRFRAAVLRESLMLIVMGLLAESPLSEWEVLDALHRRFTLTPTARDFHKLVIFVVGAGYADVEPSRGGRRLVITSRGKELFRRLEEVSVTIASGLDSTSSERPNE